MIDVYLWIETLTPTVCKKKNPHLNDLNSFCKEKTSIKMMPTNSKSSIEPNLYA